MAKSNVRALRKHMGMNDKEFGEALNVTSGAVRMWESGKALMGEDRINDLFRVARDKQVEVSTDWLFSGKGDEPGWVGSAEPIRRYQPRPPRQEQSMISDTIPVKSSADNGDGSVTIGPALEHAQRPRNLIGREGAYGLFISNDDMAPVFRYGDIVWVDPILPPARDSEVVVEGRDRTAAIGTLTMLNREAVTVEVLKPERRKIEMEREADTKVHRIVGKEARR
jgi:transcriptional regulator with XRE-family HTH domain